MDMLWRLNEVDVDNWAIEICTSTGHILTCRLHPSVNFRDVIVLPQVSEYKFVHANLLWKPRYVNNISPIVNVDRAKVKPNKPPYKSSGQQICPDINTFQSLFNCVSDFLPPYVELYASVIVGKFVVVYHVQQLNSDQLINTQMIPLASTDIQHVWNFVIGAIQSLNKSTIIRKERWRVSCHASQICLRATYVIMTHVCHPRLENRCTFQPVLHRHESIEKT